MTRLDLTRLDGFTLQAVVAAVLLGVLAFGTARILASDGPGTLLRKWLEPLGWSKAWVSGATGVVHDEAPAEGTLGYGERYTPRRSEFRLGGFAVWSPAPAVARFLYKLSECPFCVGFHTSWIAWSIVCGFRPWTLSWWVGVFVVRGVQAFMVTLERK